MTPESFYYHANKAKTLLDVVGNHYAKQEYGKAHIILDQILDLLHMCKNQTRSIDRYRKMYCHLLFIYEEATNYVHVKHREYDLSRDQAIQLRNELRSRGMSLFQVMYESNGVIDWDTKDEPDYLVVLIEAFGTHWRIKRSETNPYTFFFSIKQGEAELTEQQAISMGLGIKRLYPRLTVVVFYGSPRKRVTVDTYDMKPKEEIVPGPDPHDTGN